MSRQPDDLGGVGWGVGGHAHFRKRGLWKSDTELGLGGDENRGETDRTAMLYTNRIHMKTYRFTLLSFNHLKREPGRD